MTIEHNKQGTTRITTLHRGQIVSRLYIGYRKRQAVKMFKQELKRSH